MPKFEAPHAYELWKAGACLCGICGEPVPAPPKDAEKRTKSMGTVEHVFPKSPKACDLPRIGAFRRMDRDSRRKVIAHRRCNGRKSNRAPTACEVIFLWAVNARLRGRPYEVSASKRTAARRARRKAAKARGVTVIDLIAEMQAEVDAF